MDRIEAVQLAIDAVKAKSYLEIGTLKDECFSKIKCDLKVGVDPVSGGTHRMTSDTFFESNITFFDVVFIDGDHHHLQVQKDIINSVKFLSSHGILLMHDCNPHCLMYEGFGFCGTTWRAFANNRQDLNLDGIVGNFDHGVGAIRKRSNPYPITLFVSYVDLSYSDLEAHRHDWMRLVDETTFVNWIKDVR